ncbi:MAG: hypothetical protein JWQ27_1009 [Ferruginibacter sp.]|nr:hypothetical protein [Ferruginibacter sp.]
MKLIVFLLAAGVFLSCRQPATRDKIVEPTKDSTEAHSNFFPVSSYIRGQIKGLKTDAANPLSVTTVNGQSDSSWLRLEQLDSIFKPFVEPVIDTANLIGFFSEKKFLDQSLDAFTFTYDPIGKLPDSMLLQHYDVYVNPETGFVKRVYLMKKTATGGEQQLTWLADNWAKIVDIRNDASGKPSVMKEQLIKWKF